LTRYQKYAVTALDDATAGRKKGAWMLEALQERGWCQKGDRIIKADVETQAKVIAEALATVMEKAAQEIGETQAAALLEKLSAALEDACSS